jgi:hypothetical protein
MRWCKLIENETTASCPRIRPLEQAAEGTMSVEVSTVTAAAPGVTAPIVKPEIVIVKAVAGITAPAVVMTKEVAVVAPNVAVNAGMLLDPAASVGVKNAAKNAAG